MNIRQTLVIIAAAFAAITCRDAGVGPEGGASASLLGTVTDPLGHPLSGVGVHYIFALDPTTALVPLKKPLPTTTIEFDLPVEGIVTLKILRYGTRELIATLLDHVPMAAGVQSVEFDATPLTNGLYIYQLHIEGMAPEERIMALLKLEVRELEASAPITTTDARGHFTLPYAVLGVGVRLAIAMDAPGQVRYVVISDSISLVLTRAGYQSLVVPVTVDTTRNRSMEFRMIPASQAQLAGPRRIW